MSELDEKLDSKFDKITQNMEKMLMTTTASLVDILDQKINYSTKVNDKKNEELKDEIAKKIDDSAKAMNTKIEKLAERLAAVGKRRRARRRRTWLLPGGLPRRARVQGLLARARLRLRSLTLGLASSSLARLHPLLLHRPRCRRLPERPSSTRTTTTNSSPGAST